MNYPHFPVRVELSRFPTILSVWVRHFRHSNYSIPKLDDSSTANRSFSNSISNVPYGGRSSRLKHVCALGKLVGLPHFSIQNFLGPLLPRSASKPS